MTLKEIRDEIRDATADTGAEDSDLLWPDAEINRYINRIQREIAKQTFCLRDARTASVCLLVVDPVDYTTYAADSLDEAWAQDQGSPLYQLDVTPYALPLNPAVLKIDTAKVVNGFHLVPVSAAKWEQNPEWEQHVSMPTEFATDLSSDVLAVNGRSATAYKLQLAVRRLPLATLVGDADVPEIRASYHDAFLNGVLGLMYGKQDAESHDPKKAKKHTDLFEDDLDDIRQQEIILDSRLKANNSLAAFM